MKMNVKLLREVKKHILEEPLRYEQNVVLCKGLPGTHMGESDHVFPACGTVACIGGWIDVLTSRRKLHPVWYLSYRRTARKLGIPRKDVGRLVAYTTDCEEGSSWPRKFRTRYEKAKRPATKAKIAADRIEHFIATKGKE